MVNLNTVSVITLSVNGLNTPVKRQESSEQLKKKVRCSYILLEVMHIKCRNAESLKGNGWERYTGDSSQKENSRSSIPGD